MSRMTQQAETLVESFQSPEDKLRDILRSCLTEGETQELWEAARETVGDLDDPLNLTEDEPGVVLVEQLASNTSPSQLLSLLRYCHTETQDLFFNQWQQVVLAIPLANLPPAADFAAAARAFTSLRAIRVAELLEERFIEGGDDPRNRGDLYLTHNDRYFFNFTYLCGEFGLGLREAIESLGALARMVAPSDEDFDRLGGKESFAELIDTLLPLEGDQIPQALGELLPLVELPFTEVTAHLPRNLISRLAVTAIARRLGFALSSRQLLELYEIFAVHEVLQDRERVFTFLENLYDFEPQPEEGEAAWPSAAWKKHWNGLRKTIGTDTLEQIALTLIPVYSYFADMLGEPPFYRLTAAWQAASMKSEEAASWVSRMTTEHGEISPILAGSLLHEDTPPTALQNLAIAWKQRVSQVPLSSSWSRKFTVLVLRRAISRQRRWLLERLTDLYLRGGGYEAGETREIIEAVLERLLDEMELSEAEMQQLNESGLHFDLLPDDINIFTGETVDASRWASPTSAYKYVRTLLRLEDRGLDYLASLVSERRIITIEKALRRLDFHTSVQQVVACVEAFEGDPKRALEFFLLLLHSEGERPTEAWLEHASELLDPLSEDAARNLFWEFYRWDIGDAYSLNPGLFWALRLVPSPSSVAKLAKAATEMVRRKPSFAVAALDTLDAIGTRGALSAILQMRRRIRNRKVVKLINRTIDRIADDEGLDRDVFLDYAVDTGELERDSSRLFDFGSHQVTLRLELDGRISTTVLDAKGRHLRSFPKTAKDADPALYKEFQATKKLLVETLSYQTRRLEQSMINGRIWRGKDFVEIFAEHPVMAHLGRRLIFAKVSTRGKFTSVFLPNFKTFLTHQGKRVNISDRDRICILHPLYLSEKDRTAWKKILSDKQIEQPFPQIYRSVYEPLPSEHETQRTQRLVDLKCDAGDLYKVVKERGWSTDGGGPWEVGNATHSYRIYPSAEQTVHLDTDVLGYDKKLTILDIRFTKDKDGAACNIKTVHPVVYSEAFRDLMLCFKAEDKPKKKKKRKKK